MPEISTIIPTFRRGLLLRQAIHSVLTQEGVEVEVIVNDDDPSASGRDYACLEDNRVKYFVRGENSNARPALVRNEAALEAVGAVLHFLDDDDVVTPGAYLAVKDALAHNSVAGAVFGVIEPFGSDDGLMVHEREFFRSAAKRARFATNLGPLQNWWLCMEQNFRSTMIVNSACYIRKRHFIELGGYDSSLPILEDVEFWARAMRRLPVLFLDRQVLSYRITGTSLMQRSAGTEHEGGIIAYKKMHQAYKKDEGLLNYLLAKGVAKTLARVV